MSIKHAPVFVLYILALLGSSQANATSISFVTSSPITGSVIVQAGHPVNGQYAAFTNPQNMALGATVTVSGTIPGFPLVHSPEYITDGNYGNGRSWIDLGSTPWLTINLGSIKYFDTVSFGRDRLDNFNDRDPGQFTISISNDNSLFTQIFDSAGFGFSGFLDGRQTIQTNLNVFSAQYIKLQFANSGAAIDEVEIKNTSSIPLPATTWLVFPGLAWLGLSRGRGFIWRHRY